MFKIYNKPNCPCCTKAKNLLNCVGESYKEYMFDSHIKIGRFKRLGFTTFPQIFKDKQYIGGYSDLDALLSTDDF